MGSSYTQSQRSNVSVIASFWQTKSFHAQRPHCVNIKCNWSGWDFLWSVLPDLWTEIHIHTEEQAEALVPLTLTLTLFLSLISVCFFIYSQTELLMAQLIVKHVAEGPAADDHFPVLQGNRRLIYSLVCLYRPILNYYMIICFSSSGMAL